MWHVGRKNASKPAPAIVQPPHDGRSYPPFPLTFLAAASTISAYSAEREESQNLL
jgi:hypothetical protein